MIKEELHFVWKKIGGKTEKVSGILKWKCLQKTFYHNGIENRRFDTSPPKKQWRLYRSVTTLIELLYGVVVRISASAGLAHQQDQRIIRISGISALHNVYIVQFSPLDRAQWDVSSNLTTIILLNIYLSQRARSRGTLRKFHFSEFQTLIWPKYQHFLC